MNFSQEPLELWGGVECTINRVGDSFFDQCAWSGHRDRVEEDLQAISNLGLRTLRTGVLWEQVTRDGWSYADHALRAMRDQAIRPIVGLLHHGSGPEFTSLCDPDFPSKLANYALSVAQRFPWLEDYTPVNEPQTTARFSCLYRFWYPHSTSMREYIRALLNEIKGVALSMQAIRSVQPRARLVHTEDAGATYATPPLERQRNERENRRWLGLDLLCGRVDPLHPLYCFLLAQGASESELMWFLDHPTPPDVIGLNYYVTSDRFLDHRVHLYPDFMKGGDTGHEPLVDVEAVRIRPEGISGAGTVLKQAWDRYRLPLAITEAHLGCTPDEQVRWLAEVWRGAEQARAEGADVKAVTVWGLLGLYNWCHLCTQNTGAYEPGVFDIRDGFLAETDLALLVRQLAAGEQPMHPALAQSGWWRRASRLNLPSPDEFLIPSMAGAGLNACELT